MEKSLRNYFDNNQDRLIYKWDHYFDIYERYFSQYRDREIVVLEIGVLHGGSLQMWKHYFGNRARIIGLDIDPDCKKYEEENIEIWIGSQSDRAFLRKLRQEIPKVDILIDDGGHTMVQQIVTFEELFAHVKEDGIYMCEDIHTSYWLQYGGGLKRRGTFIEFTKNLIDQIHAFHSEQPGLKPSALTHSIQSIHFYDSVVVIEKGKREKPFRLKSGHESEKNRRAPTALEQRKWKLKSAGLTTANKVLRFFRLPGFIWR